jgi:hypothetical protein
MDNEIYLKYILPLFIFGVLIISLIYISNFFALSAGLYLGYLLWLIGLAIFYFLLPKNRVSKFTK